MEDTLEETRSIISGFLEVSDHNATHAYGACFSSLKDSLSQWRGYGQGVAIGFDRAWLQDIGFHHTNLTKINYDPVTAKNILSLLLEAFLNETILHVEKVDYKGIKEALKYSFHAYVERQVTSIKHHAFSDENEWRLSSFRLYFKEPNDDPKINFRIKDDVLIPYVEFKPDYGHTLPIISVQIGPVEKMKESLFSSIAMLLVKHGYGNVSLSFSNVPFRP